MCMHTCVRMLSCDVKRISDCGSTDLLTVGRSLEAIDLCKELNVPCIFKTWHLQTEEEHSLSFVSSEQDALSCQASVF